jgi:hypothetical protein
MESWCKQIRLPEIYPHLLELGYPGLAELSILGEEDVKELLDSFCKNPQLDFNEKIGKKAILRRELKALADTTASNEKKTKELAGSDSSSGYDYYVLYCSLLCD